MEHYRRQKREVPIYAGVKHDKTLQLLSVLLICFSNNN